MSTYQKDAYGCLIPEYCLYCGIEVTGEYRSKYNNALCEKHYNKLYPGERHE